MSYLPRVYDSLLQEKLNSKGATLVEGPKWCGKTTTASMQCNSRLLMHEPTTKARNLELAEVSPQTLLVGETPRLIDEWQIAPKLWDAVRFEVDVRGEFAQFVLTGSSTPPDFSSISHSGAGRINKLRMHTMSLFESHDSSGKVSLAQLFAGNEPDAAPRPTTIQEIAYLICRGGWPVAIGKSEKIALAQAYDYVDAIAASELSELQGIKRNPARILEVLRVYSRYVSSQGKVSKMLADFRGADVGISDLTMRSYLDALANAFVIEELPAWNPNLRSKTAIRTTPVRHFTDPSIAVASLGCNPDGLIKDLDTLGLLFESTCIRDLRVYADDLDGHVSHYRDSNGLECDAVVHKRNGDYALIEIKLGGETLIEEGATNLKKLRDIINTSVHGEPAFLMVLVGVGDIAYKRKDGVLVVPIGCLGP